MSGFDDPGVFFSDSFGGPEGPADDGVKRSQIKKRFKEFLRQFRVGTDRTGFTYKYRDELKRHYTLGEYWVEVEMEDLASFDEELSDCLYKLPSENLPLSDQVSRLVKVPGIVISTTAVRAKATKVCLQCRGCRSVISNIPLPPGLQGYALPRKCNAEQAGRVKCPVDPYFILPDRCVCIDFQMLRLQESPDAVPHGEMPRHLQLYCDRYLCDRVVPGNRVTVMGIYSIKKGAPAKTQRRGRDRAAGVGIRSSYLRVVGIQVDTEGAGRGGSGSVTPEEEEQLRTLAASPSVYQALARSLAPSIYGSDDLKKAIACLLFGGSRKRLPDGLTRRGDINLLMLGDPGTAKSQLLKFVERCSPIGVSLPVADTESSVTSCVFQMREDDRVAIHEAMEQQTISIAKAGITTTLNSRCSVLAAANSVFGRWDDTKGEDNIDFMPTILSRFDMIFIVKDQHDQQRDMNLARHVMNVHLSAQTQTEGMEGEISLATLKKYIAYARVKCGPRLSVAAAEKLKNRYVVMRSGAREHERESDRRASIPITVRQLEAVVRIAESLAKMKLQAVAGEEEVDEALRLFQVSTLDAALSGSLSGVEGFTTQEDQEMISRIEKQLKRRFAIGSQVSEHSIIQDFTKQKYPEQAIYKVLQLMMRRGELQHRLQRKVLYRVK
uniref:DNA replication licensing factor MCM5 n=1 Tax=Paramormyrops kingsleyae TaxID=1676925 RepID=A0A3B3RY64_9TELE